ncbi:MAG TPA: winged helix DNA-binding domain-containing protein, partial [Chloroflexota bacterium]|nr:winged helix DNA-binding domain-containing protein [Chloroflexota bacterium]
MTITTLTRRDLNRAFLHRQLLLGRAAMSPAAALDHLVGMQAQAPQAPYAGLWTRLEDFQPAELSLAIAERRSVRLALMRSTIHLVTARDCLALRPVLQPALERGIISSANRRLPGVDLDDLAEAGRSLVEQNPLIMSELAKRLGSQWPEADPFLLGYAVRALVPLVQVTPRGEWRKGGAAAHTSAEVWLAASLAKNREPDEMIRRYLAAYGPATLRDICSWSGLTRLGP